MASINVSFAGKALGKKLALVNAVLALVTAVVYYTYESPLKSVDSMVMVIMVGVAVCNVAYYLLRLNAKIDIVGLVEVAGAGLAAWALTEYLNDDIANLADLLNGVVIFSGGSGSTQMIFTIIGLTVAMGLIDIVICFMPSRDKA